MPTDKFSNFKLLQNTLLFYCFKLLRTGIDDDCFPIERAPDKELFFVPVKKNSFKR